jgi:Protein of unknown function (DUF3152)
MVRPRRRIEHVQRSTRPLPTQKRLHVLRATWRAEFLLALILSALAIVVVDSVTDDGVSRTTVAGRTAPVPPHIEPTEEATAAPDPQGEGPRDPTTKKPRVFQSTGKLAIVPGTGRPSGPRPVRTFTVQVETGVPISANGFARRVQSILASPRSWGGLEGFSVQRVDDRNADFHVILATPDTTDELCKPLDTDGIYSCQRENRAILNAWRWFKGADAYRNDLRSYRIYMVNHEVGHVWLHPHLSCPAAGERAPVMVQQTVAVAPCKPNPWPLPSEANG